MYTIVLHPKNADPVIIDNDNYNERSRKTISPQLELEENAFGSLSFTLPSFNVAYEMFDVDELSMAEVRVYHANEPDPVFRGRLLEVKRDSQKNRAVIFEGELAYLADTIQEPAEYKEVIPKVLVEKLLTVHNRKSPHQFLLGDVTVTDNDSADHITGRVNRGSYSIGYNDTTWSVLQSLVSELGGYFKVRWVDGVRYLDYLKEHDDECSQTIEFGKNLLDYAEEWSLAELYTVVVPLGANVKMGKTDEKGNEISEELTVASVNNGSPYLTDRTDIIQRYGRREKAIKFSGIADPYHLYQIGILYLNNIQFDNMVLNLTAADLYELGFTQEATELIRFQSKVHATAAPYGLDKEFPVTKVSIPLKDPAHAVYTMSTNTRGIRSISTKITDIADEAQDAVDNLSDEVDDVKNELTKHSAVEAGSPEDWIFGIPLIVYRVGERGSAYVYRGSFVNKVWDAVHASKNFIRENWQRPGATETDPQNISVITGWPELWSEDASRNMTIKHGALSDGETWDDLSSDSDNIRSWITFNDKTAGSIPFNMNAGETGTRVVYVVARFKNPADCRNGHNDAIIGYQASISRVLYCIDDNFAVCTMSGTTKTQILDISSTGIMAKDGLIVIAMGNNIAEGTEHPFKSNLIIGVQPNGDDLGSHVYAIPTTSISSLWVSSDLCINHYTDGSTPIPSGFEDNEHSIDIVRIVECKTPVDGQITMDEVYDNVKWFVGRYISGTITDGGKLPEDETPSPEPEPETDEGGEDNG